MDESLEDKEEDNWPKKFDEKKSMEWQGVKKSP